MHSARFRLDLHNDEIVLIPVLDKVLGSGQTASDHIQIESSCSLVSKIFSFKFIVANFVVAFFSSGKTREYLPYVRYMIFYSEIKINEFLVYI
jgi:hypothetical protein